MTVLHVGDLDSEFSMNKHEILAERSAVKEGIKTAAPETLRTRVLYIAYHQRNAGRVGKQPMFDNNRQGFFWPLMANDVCVTVVQCMGLA